MNKSEVFSICVRLFGAPQCPYMCFPCRKFYLNLGAGVCFQNGVKCCWEPSWASNACRERLAILKKDGRLHIDVKGVIC